MITNILVTLQLEGFHKWENAPKEVDFLQNRHRHLFCFELEKTVVHNDRDVEIILFKRKVQQYLESRYQYIDSSSKQITLEFGNKSCEMLAEELLLHFECYRVKVTEDLENGSVVYSSKQWK